MTINIKKTKHLFFALTLIITTVISIPVHAADQITYGEPFYLLTAQYPSTSSNTQYRFITVKSKQETPLTTIPGQPPNGTYLKKGDALFYGSNGGSSIPVSFGINTAFASLGVSFNIPMGKVYNTHYGSAHYAQSPGYYVIKVKKTLIATVLFQQHRTKLSNNRWSEWSKPTFHGKSYTVDSDHPTLVLVKR